MVNEKKRSSNSNLQMAACFGATIALAVATILALSFKESLNALGIIALLLVLAITATFCGFIAFLEYKRIELISKSFKKTENDDICL
jgi:Mn2+/Fe2+ NRAMP family transporter